MPVKHASVKWRRPTPIQPTSRINRNIRNLAIADLRRGTTAQKVFAKLLHDKVEPGHRVFLAAIENAPNAQEAINLFDKMLENSATARANAETYSKLICACCKAKSWKLAIALHKELEIRGVTPKANTINPTITACYMDGDRAEAVRLCQLLQTLSTAKTIHTYKSMIRVATLQDNPQLALKHFEEMTNAGIIPDSHVYDCIYQICEKGKTVTEFIKLFESQQKPRSAAYFLAIAAYSKRGDFDKVIELFQEMKNSNRNLNLRTYNNAIDAYGKTGKHGQAWKLFGEIENNPRISPNRITFNCLKSSCVSLNRHVHFLNSKIRHAIIPDRNDFTAIMNAHSKNGNVSEALAVLSLMSSHGIELKSFDYNHALEICQQHIDVEWSLRVFNLMDRKNCVNMNSYNIIIETCRLAGNTTLANDYWVDSEAFRNSNRIP